MGEKSVFSDVETLHRHVFDIDVTMSRLYKSTTDVFPNNYELRITKYVLFVVFCD